MKRAATIAIVDDDAGVRNSLSSLVRSLGHEVRAYGSAEDLLSDLDSSDADCVVTDIHMPLMSGEQLLAALAALGSRLPVIVVTAFPSEALRQRVIAGGAFAYLVKPVEGATLAHWIMAALEGGDRDYGPR